MGGRLTVVGSDGRSITTITLSFFSVILLFLVLSLTFSHYDTTAQYYLCSDFFLPLSQLQKVVLLFSGSGIY